MRYTMGTLFLRKGSSRYRLPCPSSPDLQLSSMKTIPLHVKKPTIGSKWMRRKCMDAKQVIQEKDLFIRKGPKLTK